MFGRLVRRSASMRSPASFAPSAANRSRRRSTICSEFFHEPAKRELIAVRAKSAHDCNSRIGESRFSSLGLTRIDVRHVHFDKRYLNTSESITNRERRMRVRSSIHECTVDFSLEGVNVLDDL